MDIEPLTLTADETFWLSIFNDTTGEPDNWFWGAQRNAGISYFRTSPDAAWQQGAEEFDFQLTSASVPEPSALGLAGLRIARARRRR